MKTFCIDFRGYCEIEADTEEEARQRFCDLIYNDEPLPKTLYEVETIDEVETIEEKD